MSLTIEIAAGNLKGDFQNALFGLRDTYQQCSAYTSSSIIYRRQIAQDNGIDSNNKSFIVRLDGKPVALFFGVLSYQDQRRVVDVYGGRPCVSFFNTSLISKKILQMILAEVKTAIKDAGTTFVYRDFMIDRSISPISRHLLSVGADVRQRFTQVIDLEKSEKDLKKDVRKSYTSLINWGLKELSITVHGKSNDISWDEMDLFRHLHAQVSGKDTRTKESWKKQFKMCASGEAFIVMGRLNGRLVSAGFFTNSHDSCYYGASASCRDLFEKPIFHALLWTAILHAKSIGCKWFEVGEQLYQGIGSPSEKELGISRFKSGFGGTIQTFIDLELNV